MGYILSKCYKFDKEYNNDLLQPLNIELNNKIDNLEEKIITKYSVPLEEMPRNLSDCDILISHFNFHGAWPHNCSIKHLEYMSIGKPVVASNVGEVNFAIEHNVNWFLVDEGNEEEFAMSIIKLIDNPDLREKFGKNGREKILANHTWDKHVEKSLNQII